jgi:histidinol dehydrogenase
MDFMKYSSIVSYSKDALKKASEDIKILTDTEGFDAHYTAVSVRLGNG